MSRVTQSRAQTEANAKLLRSLVKSPDNKVCVDCKKNDPRWASWNLGCFLCIRCSGIHRSMGTHISKVKSIDLDIWTHEQMESVQRWGNRRCNLFWEAHLKKGHVPPEHKIESFIRSGGSGSGGGAKQVAREPEGGVANKSVNVDLLDDPSPSSAPTTVAKPAPPTAASIPTPTPTPTTAPTKPNAGGGIFDLDWHDPTPTTNTTTAGGSSGGGTKAKNDIMSLFAAKPVVPTPSTNGGEGFGDFTSFSSNPVPSTTTSLGALNASFNRLDLTSNDKPTTNTNPWNSSNTTTTTTASGGLFDTQHVWGSTTTTAATGSANKDDAFADIWGDFK